MSKATHITAEKGQTSIVITREFKAPPVLVFSLYEDPELLAQWSKPDINGNRVFVIKLRDGSYKKLMIQSFAGGTYNLKYANFDGTEEKTVAIKAEPLKS